MLLSELNYHILKKKKKEKVNENELPTTTEHKGNNETEKKWGKQTARSLTGQFRSGFDLTHKTPKLNLRQRT